MKIKSIKAIIAFVFCMLTINVSMAQNEYLTQTGLKNKLHSEILNESRSYWVELPNSYNPKNDRTYPVIYVLDGSTHLDAVKTIHSYYSGGFFPEMIIVGISNLYNRERDLTTSKISTRRGVSYDRPHGEAENFTQFIEKELIPHIDDIYKTTQYRTLIGHSYAGLFTINTLLNHTELFENYIAIDPSLDWDNQKLLKSADEILKNKTFKGKTLFMTMGGILHMQNNTITIDNVMEDTSEFTLFARSIMEFSKIAESNKNSGLASQWRFYEKDFHGTIALPSILDGLIETFEWFQMENTDKINDFDTTISELNKIITHRAKKLESNFGYQVPPYPEDLLNMSGYMTMDMQQPEKSKMYFEQAIKYYPKSPNVYDSMADYYLAQKDYENAIKNLSIAYEISGNERYKLRIEELKTQKN